MQGAGCQLGRGFAMLYSEWPPAPCRVSRCLQVGFLATGGAAENNLCDTCSHTRTQKERRSKESQQPSLLHVRLPPHTPHTPPNPLQLESKSKARTLRLSLSQSQASHLSEAHSASVRIAYRAMLTVVFHSWNLVGVYAWFTVGWKR